MKKADIARYFTNKPCNDNFAGSDMCFFSGMRGGAAVFAAAHPTMTAEAELLAKRYFG